MNQEELLIAIDYRRIIKLLSLGKSLLEEFFDPGEMILLEEGWHLLPGKKS